MTDIITKKVTIEIWSCDQCPHYCEVFSGKYLFLPDYCYCDLIEDETQNKKASRVEYYDKLKIPKWCPLK